jgi:hypothetical protein
LVEKSAIDNADDKIGQGLSLHQKAAADLVIAKTKAPDLEAALRMIPQASMTPEAASWSSTTTVMVSVFMHLSP